MTAWASPRRDAGVCPADREPEFVSADDAGRELYNLQSRVVAAANRLDAAHRELEHAEHEIVAQSAVITSSDATGESRAPALISTKDLAAESGTTDKGEIAEFEGDKARYERGLAEYWSGRPPGA